MRAIINTVGTSLISNTRHAAGMDKSQEPSPDQLRHHLLYTPPEKATAETNALSRLLQEGDRLLFLHSATGDGRLCAAILAQFYADRGYDTDRQEIPDLTYDRHSFKNRGLRSFVTTLLDCIDRERRQGREVCINATGGFKAETVYAAIVGQIRRAPVYYIYEKFDDVIEMPPPPIALNYGLVLRYEEFFEWLEAAWVEGTVRSGKEVTQRLEQYRAQGSQDIAELRFLIVWEDGTAFLSPLGEALYRQYLDLVTGAPSAPVLLSSVARATYRTAEPGIQRIFDRMLRKLQIPELRQSGSDAAPNSDCFVFPRDKRDERLFYYLDKEGNPRVCVLCDRHGPYEQLLNKGIRRAHYRDFHPL
jgi:putative CRISPR-associated protein (TIGR02619 family)